ncbi:MAG: hypothetical protein HPY89_12760 [Pelotomaculum sp.]|uniref:Carbohydrate binding module family 25 domain-containing protein n=1 Tax=Pelotomaculum thermopropionicum (strain DSM 13744 / JCM 10971 / SI) TaxID=370438 RepID=A5CY61_PELTS|nr:hypothetical protein [Pelotomaculum sp.]BAF61082.1 hypothetical protein PTH_2901 [Pelotomaculum thermopropionicum SI]
MNSIKPFVYSHPIQGVQVKPLTEDGKKVSILYNGLLAQAGAGEIYLHCGTGDISNWENISDLPMERKSNGWEKTVRLESSRQLNFCFRDGINNWDNNGGANWAYRISG